MSKQWWELGVQTNEQGQVTYIDDCEITILELGSIKEYANRNFQNVAVAGQGGVKIDNFSISYAKTDTVLTPADMNKPLACRIKVENSNNKYSINGRKYTIATGPKQQKSGGSGGGGRPAASGGGRSYTPPTQDEILGKCETLLVQATLQAGNLDPVQLFASKVQLDAIADLAKWLVRPRG